MVGPAMKAALHSLTKEGWKEERQKSAEQKEQRRKEKEQEKAAKLEKKNHKENGEEHKEGEEMNKDIQNNTNNVEKTTEERKVTQDGDQVKETKTTEQKSDWNSNPTQKKTETTTVEKRDGMAPVAATNTTGAATAIKKTETHGDTTRNIAISPLDLEDRIRQLEIQKIQDRELMLQTEDEIIRRLEERKAAAENRIREADAEIYKLRTEAILEHDHHHKHKEHKKHHKHHSEHKHHHKHDMVNAPLMNESEHMIPAQTTTGPVPQNSSVLPPAHRSESIPAEGRRLILTPSERMDQTVYPSQGTDMGMKGGAVPFQTPIVSTTMLPPTYIEQN